MVGRNPHLGRIEEIAWTAYGQKMEDLEEYELREVHEIEALLQGQRVAPQRHGRIDTVSYASASGRLRRG